MASFFCFFSLPEQRPGTILNPLSLLSEFPLGLVMLGTIFLLMDHSDAFGSASSILPLSSLEIAGISSFLSSSSLLLSMVSSSFFELLLVLFLSFKKLFSQPKAVILQVFFKFLNVSKTNSQSFCSLLFSFCYTSSLGF